MIRSCTRPKSTCQIHARTECKGCSCKSGRRRDHERQHVSRHASRSTLARRWHRISWRSGLPRTGGISFSYLLYFVLYTPQSASSNTPYLFIDTLNLLRCFTRSIIHGANKLATMALPDIQCISEHWLARTILSRKECLKLFFSEVLR